MEPQTQGRNNQNSEDEGGGLYNSISMQNEMFTHEWAESKAQLFYVVIFAFPLGAYE